MYKWNDTLYQFKRELNSMLTTMSQSSSPVRESFRHWDFPYKKKKEIKRTDLYEDIWEGVRIKEKKNKKERNKEDQIFSEKRRGRHKTGKEKEKTELHHLKNCEQRGSSCFRLVLWHIKSIFTLINISLSNNSV